MRSRVLAVLLALPLLAFDCGGNDPAPPTSPFGMICKLQIRGTGAGMNEDLWCIASVFDYAELGNPGMYAFELVAYRGMTQVGGSVGVFLDGRPALASPYGWTASTTNVSSGSALRAIGDVTAVPSTYQETNRALAPMLATLGTGAMSITFSKIPPVGATGPALTDVHGTLSGTLPAVDGTSPPVTFAAVF
ncbi:MAG TPA: hypothetical protein VIV57_10480 [Anaeromyxobacter sp.]